MSDSPPAIRPALFLFVPLFSLGLLVLALSHNGQRPRQARAAYGIIALLGVLASLAGALPLSHASNAHAEALIHAFLSLLLGIPIVHLLSPPSWLLMIALSGATLLALVVPFLTRVPALVPPAAFLLFTLVAFARVSISLYCLVPINIHVATHRTGIPLTLLHHPRHEKLNSVDSSISTITAVDIVQQISSPLRTQLIYSRSRSLLVILFAAQLANLAAYACALGNSFSSSGPLEIVQAACTVLAVTGTMSAYLLHAYNAHLSSSSPPQQTSADASAIPMVNVHPQQTQASRPVMIHLAPPSPRRRADGLAFGFGSSKAYEGFGYEYGTLDGCSPGSSVDSPPLPSMSPTPPPTQMLPPTPQAYTTTWNANIPRREPIILTYIPPKHKSSDRSLFESTIATDGKSLFSAMSIGSGSGVPPDTTATSHVPAYQGQPKRPSTSPKPKKKPAEDPAAYITKRGSLPAPPKRLFGWEFGWDGVPSPLPVHPHATPASMEVESQGSSFMDLDLFTHKGKGEKERARRLKRNTVGHVPALVPMLSPTREEPASPRSLIGPGSSSPVSPTRKVLKKRPTERKNKEKGKGKEKRSSFIHVQEQGHAPTTTEKSTVGFVHRKMRSSISSSARPAEAVPISSPKSPIFKDPSANADVQRGLHLKKNFKLGVGRTPGPGLTLAAGGGASVVKAGGFVAVQDAVLDQQRPGLDERQQEMKAVPPLPLPSKRVPHPFAEVEAEEEHESVREEGEDMIQLEKEMEELRGMFGGLRADDERSVTHSVKVVTTPTIVDAPTAAASRTLTQTQPIQTPTPGPTPEKVKVKAKARTRTIVKTRSGTNLGKETLRRRTSVSMSNVKSEWALQSSSSTMTTTTAAAASSTPLASPLLPYKFPVFFPSSITSSSSLSSLPPFPLSPTPTPLLHPQAAQSQPRLPLARPLESQAASTPSTPRVGGSARLSAITINSVRSAFAGVGARMSGATARTSVNSGSSRVPPNKASALYGGGLIAEDSDGDFMDLRDPFASPPPCGESKVRRSTSAGTMCGSVSGRGGDFGGVDSSSDGHGYGSCEQEDVFGAGGGFNVVGVSGSGGGIGIERKMSAWGRLPMPARSVTSLHASASAASASAAASGARRNASGVPVGAGKTRRYRKERRTRKTTLTSLGVLKNPVSVSAGSGPAGMRAGQEDADFGVEEALLAQRLLRRLDSDGWEGRM